MTSRHRNKKRSGDPMEGRRPWIRVDEARIAEDPRLAGGYRVSISGRNLMMAVSPPRIRVGGVELDDLEFDPSGKQITGTLSRKPESDDVTVDYGFARGDTTLNRRESKES